MDTEKLQEPKLHFLKSPKYKKAISKVYRYLLFLVFFVGGYFSSEFYHYFLSKTQIPEKQEKNKYEVIDFSDVSVAVDDNKNLLLIEKSTGEYKTYSDSVGLSIFSLYSNSIYNSYKSGE